MGKTVLITGGAGFIGSHLTDELLANGHKVRILDNLCEQVHGPNASVPDYLNKQAFFIHGDVCDPDHIRAALEGADAVVHLAAAVGVGQSMYEIGKYVRVNSLGTAVLLEALIAHPVEKLLVASSMSIYGEGLYQTAEGRIVTDAQRRLNQLKDGVWEVQDQHRGFLVPMPTPETKTPVLSSIYALSKYDQENMCLIAGRAYGIPTVALRLFNVYGPRQALSNPYTGVLAIFAARLLNGKAPLIFEDGLQQRDFVSVYDVAHAFRLALDSDLDDEVLNIGSGQSFTIREIADMMTRIMNRMHLKPVVTGKYRAGDIRHCYASIQRARRVIGYRPQKSLADGLDELSSWLAHQQAVDHVESAHSELAERGLSA